MSHDSIESLSSDMAKARDVSGNKQAVYAIYNINGAMLKAKEVPTIESLVCTVGQRGGTCSGCSKKVSCLVGSGDNAL